MAFAGMNYLAVLIAAIAAFVIGAGYYGVLGKPWMKAARIDPATAQMSPVLFAISFVSELVMATMVAGVVGHLGPAQVTAFNGIVSAFFLWLGFVATSMVVNHRYQGFGWSLSLIDGVHWLLVLSAMGAIIGAMGV
ncbi:MULTISPECIES: DUF1761 domain-containing protein [Ensifer]|jgi:hypothetical protein|uniref:DUF1761 domain-containing protein n=1 Tax=Ensifer TaxID=106591 RepID=UPI00046D5890|nr:MULTISPECIES: DUF1761 domain-containing protein [Ensifer]KQU77359.1 hypothetical protein ASD00_09875 [Ensifer sp. Root31]KQW56196.1 hypothetical protein ASD03_17505 [Ensifer sp. Root127]MBD9489011.1 DUF1761 domain-containing protein [Ensifer sp. ENS11]NOV18265.1 DUF1761 domain-containing protein [Ensifer canadensis]PSS63596.1 DUF1761 domain-containing protein [Ensifer sp. NM-2]